MRKKVLLVHPKSNDKLVRVPFGLLYLASFLETNGYVCDIIDENTLNDDSLSYRQIVDNDADIIGFTTYISLSIMHRVNFLSQQIKSKYPNKIIVWGGYYTTGFPEDALKYSFVDKIIAGPGELALLEIAKHANNKDYFRSSDKLISYNDHKYFIDEYLFPMLNYTKLDIDFYLKKHDIKEGVFQYITSRGCYYNCQFCFLSNSYGGRVFRKKTKDISDELTFILSKYAVKSIHFSDNMCFNNNEQARSISQIILDVTSGIGIEWRSTVRINVLNNLAEKTYEQLKKSGCSGFSIGVESGSNDVLQLMNKKITYEQILNALEILKVYKFYVNTFEFILGYPGEKKTDELQTWNLIRRIRKQFPYSTIHLNRYSPIKSDQYKSSGQNILEHIENYKKNHLVKHYASLPYNVLVFYTNKSMLKQTKKSFKGIIRNLYAYAALFRMKAGFFGCRIDYAIYKMLCH